MVIWIPYLWNRMNKRDNSPSLGTISSWVVIFILPINSALNPILYTLTTSFFREQVEVLLCRWQRRRMMKKDRKSLTSSTIFMDTQQISCYHLPSYLQRVSLKDADPRYAWRSQEPFGTVQTGGWGLVTSLIQVWWKNSDNDWAVSSWQSCTFWLTVAMARSWGTALPNITLTVLDVQKLQPR